jgi:hypothetical protein
MPCNLFDDLEKQEQKGVRTRKKRRRKGSHIVMRNSSSDAVGAFFFSWGFPFDFRSFGVFALLCFLKNGFREVVQIVEERHWINQQQILSTGTKKKKRELINLLSFL